MYLRRCGNLLRNRALDRWQLQSLQKLCDTCLDLWRMHCTTSGALVYRAIILFSLDFHKSPSHRVPTGLLKMFCLSITAAA